MVLNNHLNLLHLEKRKDRLKSLHKQLYEQDISFYSIWEGVDDKKNTKKAITIGHKRIVQFAKNNNYPNVIVGEDDLVFTAKGAWNYFISQIPESYDLFFGLIYAGEVDENCRIKNGMSGVMTLYSVNQRFYDFFLSIPDDVHIDRHLGLTAFEHEYFVVPEFCVYQSGGMSDNLKRVMYYDVYLEGKKLFGVI